MSTDPRLRQVFVQTMEELEHIVDELVASGETAVQLQLSPDLLLDPAVYDILGKIVTDHPRSKPDDQTSPKAETQAEAEAEVVSYSENALAEQTYRGIAYQVFRAPDGFRVKVHQGCAGWLEPWDCPFEDIVAADDHGRVYIDSVIQEAENQGNPQ